MNRKNDANSLPVPDDILSQALNQLYNSWFRGYRDRMLTMTDDDFDVLLAEATAMIDQYAQYPLVRNLVISFVYELDARLHSGYTKQSAEKLARIILEANA